MLDADSRYLPLPGELSLSPLRPLELSSGAARGGGERTRSGDGAAHDRLEPAKAVTQQAGELQLAEDGTDELQLRLLKALRERREKERHLQQEEAGDVSPKRGHYTPDKYKSPTPRRKSGRDAATAAMRPESNGHRPGELSVGFSLLHPPVCPSASVTSRAQTLSPPLTPLLMQPRDVTAPQHLNLLTTVLSRVLEAVSCGDA